MKNKSLTSDPPDEWLNLNEKNLRKAVPVSEEEELPVDYAFLGRFTLMFFQRKYLYI